MDPNNPYQPQGAMPPQPPQPQGGVSSVLDASGQNYSPMPPPSWGESPQGAQSGMSAPQAGMSPYTTSQPVTTQPLITPGQNYSPMPPSGWGTLPQPGMMSTPAPYPPQPVSSQSTSAAPPPRRRTPPVVGGGAAAPPPRIRRYDKPPLPIRMMDWVKRNWWAPVVGVLILIVAANIVYQVAYPSQALPPGVVVDGIAPGSAPKTEIVKKLNEVYDAIKVEIYFGSATVPHKLPTAKEVGIQVDNADRLKHAEYPLWLRLVPTSIWWAASMVKIDPPVYNYDKVTIDKYTLKELGSDCKIEPKNPTLKLEDDRFTVVKSVPGGTCNINEFIAAVQKARPGRDGKIIIRTSLNEVGAAVSNEVAQKLADSLNHALNRDLALQAGSYTAKVPSRTVKNWLSFKAVIPEDAAKEKPHLIPVVEPDRVQKYLTASVANKVEKKPGKTVISTRDFTVTSHLQGAPGVVIDVSQTLPSIYAILQDKSSTVIVATKAVGPEVQYKRTYTPSEVGFRALVEQFVHDNPGKIGVAFWEETGKKPLMRVAANAQLQLPASGFEGVYVAYAAQVGIENGSLQPTDTISGGQSITDCMEAAIERQDKDCIEALLKKVGNSVVHQYLQQAGITHTSLSGESNITTAGDMLTMIRGLAMHTLPIKRYDAIEKLLRDNRLREGMVQGVSNIYSGAGMSDAGYGESAVVTYKGKYMISYLADNKDPKVALKFISAIEKLRTEKNNLKQR